ncbi:hypothetical protein [Nonlabens antarcticus]|uniref:hypothetical protein n=1 Tax=Nonlabens antarcticus TaxID=392714 RepID=UPI0018917648|nr:hypothetical protein [Nonlabens antarcticus]
MDNLKYSTRRYDVVSLIFNGFGIYANYELFKSASNFNLGTAFLMGSSLILIVLAFANLYVLRCESSLQSKWFTLFQSIPYKPEKERNAQLAKANKFENRQERKRGVIYLGLILTTVLTLVGFVVLNLG